MGNFASAQSHNNSQNLESRVSQLEKLTEKLDKRIQTLEKLIGSQKLEPIIFESGNWREISNWRQLKMGMTTSQVREILGEPEKIDAGGVLTFWYWDYPGGPSVQFYSDSGRLYGWSEPSR